MIAIQQPVDNQMDIAILSSALQPLLTRQSRQEEEHPIRVEHEDLSFDDGDETVDLEWKKRFSLITILFLALSIHLYLTISPREAQQYSFRKNPSTLFTALLGVEFQTTKDLMNNFQ